MVCKKNLKLSSYSTTSSPIFMNDDFPFLYIALERTGSREASRFSPGGKERRVEEELAIVIVIDWGQGRRS